MASHRYGTLYVGVTNDLRRRVEQYKEGKNRSFTKQYAVTMLVYYESTDSIEVAILREKQLKGGSRQKKLDLINKLNPLWIDLYPTIGPSWLLGCFAIR